MAQRQAEILLVEEDEELAGMITHHLQVALGANVTHVTTAAEGLREELTCRHDVIIASAELADEDGIEFVRAVRVSSDSPAILLVSEPTTDTLIEAVRVGISDVLCKPFHIGDLSETVERSAAGEIRRRRASARNRRLRRLASRIVRERRDLRQRMDLICRDFVEAYRRLAQKVTESGMLTCDRESD